MAVDPRLPKVGLVLPGGGARAAYQVGVLRALADLLPARSVNPFPVVTGTSAGAVNATAIAVHADRFRVAVGNLERVWRNFQVQQVFRADTPSGPKIVYSTEMAIDQVSRTPGAITFVQAPVTNRSVKVLRIDGRTPGQQGYSLR